MENTDKIIICSNCVLDSTIDKISFNKDGICNFCTEFFFENLNTKKLNANGLQAKLNVTIQSVKTAGKKKRYDCVIGLSGGVDSSYLAYLTKEYNLRPLAVHLDNGWNSELAVSNIEKVCKKLQIDLITYVIDWNEFRDIQLSFLKASVANSDAPTDHAIFAILYRIAKKHNIKYILDGVNTNTEYVRKDMMDAGYTHIDFSQIKGIHKKFGKEPMKTYPSMSMFMKFVNQTVLGIKQISLLNLLDYNKAVATTTLMDKIGWKPYDGKHHESLFTKWHQLVYLPNKFKFDIRKLHYSDLILSGQMERQDALDALAVNPITAIQKEDLCIYVRKKLGLTQDQYNAILNAQPKSYDDYPNAKWVLDLYNRIKKFLIKVVSKVLLSINIPKSGNIYDL